MSVKINEKIFTKTEDRKIRKLLSCLASLDSAQFMAMSRSDLRVDEIEIGGSFLRNGTLRCVARDRKGKIRKWLG